MSYSEFLSWCRYRNKYGSLHLGMRLDRAVARGLAYTLSHSRRTFSVADFSPYDKAIEDNASLDDKIDRALSNFKRA